MLRTDRQRCGLLQHRAGPPQTKTLVSGRTVEIDTTLSVVALVSGLVGALLTAFLSYMVRLRVREKEDETRQKRLAYVYFIQLTEVFASDLIIKEISEKVNESLGIKEKGVGLSHAAAVYFAEQLSKVKPEDLKAIRALFKPFLTYICESLEKVTLPAAQLSELPQDSVYFYNRYMMKAQQFRTSVQLLEGALDDGDTKLLSAEMLNGVFAAYQGAAEASGLLRAAFMTYGSISSSISHAALARSYKFWKEEIAKSASQTSKLEAAKKILKEVAETNPSMQPTAGSGG